MTCTAWIELELEVDSDYHGACPGSREGGTGLKMEPDEPESVEITSVRVKSTGTEIPLAAFTPNQIESMEEDAMQAVSDAKEAAEESRAEDRAERLREEKYLD